MSIQDLAKRKGVVLGNSRANGIQNLAARVQQRKMAALSPKVKRPAPTIDPKIMAEGEKAKKFLGKSTLGQIFSKNTAKEAPRAAVQTILGAVPKLAVSLYEAPKVALNRNYTGATYKMPVFGNVTSLQTDFGKVADQVVQGKKGLGSAAWSLAQIPLTVADAAGVAKGAIGGVKGVSSAVSAGRKLPASLPKSPLGKSLGQPAIGRKLPQTSQEVLRGKQQMPEVPQIQVRTSISKGSQEPFPGKTLVQKEGDLKGISSPNSSTKTGGVNRGFIDTMKGSNMTDPELARAVSGTYTPRETEHLVQQVNDLIKTDVDKAKELALSGSGDDSVATAMELIKHYQNNGDFSSAVDIAENVAQKLTEHGRAIQAASIYNRLTPEGITMFANKQIQKFNKANPTKPLPGLTPEQAGKLHGLAKDAQTLTGEEKAIATQKMLDEVQKLIPSSLGQQIATVWKAGLLTNPGTHIANVTGNSSMLAMENLKDIPATGFDMLASLLTGKRTKALPNLGAQGQGALEGVRKAGKYLRTGIDPDNVVGKLDVQKVHLPPVLQQYTDTVFRTLGAGDKIFRQTLFKKSIAELAHVEGLNRGLKGKDLASFVDDILKNPPPAFVETATKDAMYGTFNSDNKLAELISQAKRSGSNSVGGQIANGLGDLIIPFTKTPANVAARIVDYSPAGFLKAAMQGYDGAGQRAITESLGRATLGSGMVYGGYKLGEQGLYTANYPKDEQTRNIWEAEGKQGNSVKIGDTWYNLDKISPVGNLLSMGANLADGKGPVTAGVETIKGLKDMTFLKGMSGALDAIDNPDQFGQSWVANTAASFIPSIVAATARQMDPVVRDTKKSWTDPTLNRIPGLKQTLQPRYNSLGGELRYTGNQFVNPFRPSQSNESPVTRELQRLNSMGAKLGLSEPDRKISIAGTSIPLTKEQYATFTKMSGDKTMGLLSKMIENKDYKEMSPEEQAKAIQNALEYIRKISGAKAVGQDNAVEAVREYLKNKSVNPFYK